MANLFRYKSLVNKSNRIESDTKSKVENLSASRRVQCADSSLDEGHWWSVLQYVAVHLYHAWLVKKANIIIHVTAPHLWDDGFYDSNDVWRICFIGTPELLVTAFSCMSWGPTVATSGDVSAREFNSYQQLAVHGFISAELQKSLYLLFFDLCSFFSSLDFLFFSLCFFSLLSLFCFLCFLELFLSASWSLLLLLLLDRLLSSRDLLLPLLLSSRPLSLSLLASRSLGASNFVPQFSLGRTAFLTSSSSSSLDDEDEDCGVIEISWFREATSRKWWRWIYNHENSRHRLLLVSLTVLCSGTGIGDVPSFHTLSILP